MALNSPELEVGAITGVYGNTRWEHVRHNLNRLRSLFPDHPQFPIWMGARNPADFANKNRLPGISRLASFIKEHPHQATLVCIGPLTNAALLFHFFPETVSLLSELVIMGGYLNHFEFNFGNDGAATDVVLQAELPKFISGFEVCLKQKFTTAHYDKLREHSTPRTRYLLQGLRTWLWINRLTSAGSLSKGGFYPFDPTAIAYLIRPDLYHSVQIPARHVHKNKGPLPWRSSKAWTYVDKTAWETRRKETWWSNWALRINSTAFLDLLLERLY